MVSFEINGLEKLKLSGENFKKASGTIRELILKASNDFANDAVARIKKDYLTGPRPEKLGVVTGNLRSKIRFRIEQATKETRIVIGTDVPYAAIHEFGGVAGRGKKTVIRKRPFLTPGTEDALPAFQEKLLELVKDVAERSFVSG